MSVVVVSRTHGDARYQLSVANRIMREEFERRKRFTDPRFSASTMSPDLNAIIDRTRLGARVTRRPPRHFGSTQEVVVLRETDQLAISQSMANPCIGCASPAAVISMWALRSFAAVCRRFRICARRCHSNCQSPRPSSRISIEEGRGPSPSNGVTISCPSSAPASGGPWLAGRGPSTAGRRQ